MNNFGSKIQMTEEEVIYWCMEQGILQKTISCINCFKSLILVRSSRSKDKMSWRCFNKQCNIYCSYISVRKGSFFENFSVSIKSLLIAIFYWSNQMQNKDIIKYLDLNMTVIKKLKKHLISRIKDFYQANPILMGGPGKLVQIDETMLNHKVKAHRGRAPLRQSWAFGIVDCSTKPAKGFMCLIENKSSNEILPLIYKHVREGSIIHTDEAKVYQKLGKDSKYIHRSIVHRYSFVNYNDMVQHKILRALIIK